MLSRDMRGLAEEIPTPFDFIEWGWGADGECELQCKLDDSPHDYHAAFLRTGASAEPGTDVFLCWVDGAAEQWLEDIEVCLKTRTPRDSSCTIFRGHPGKCDWAYIDPPMVAARAEADQLLSRLGLSPIWREAWDATIGGDGPPKSERNE
ncbi:hypothetical protein [Streptomyces sp. SID10815]|uniref:hypothetical protein n=1 Tax=Streptomyces sp. SID10815 TaxID=2706027 RepID=UPI0013C8A3A9|nr:hypothetical protein [Streptomyces sp. SID10815]NEA49219.1 hypothetical protein [Streptomyces sp. SID10815]